VDTIKIFLITFTITLVLLSMFLFGKYKSAVEIIGKLLDANMGQRNDKLMEMARGYRAFSGRDEVREYVRSTESGQSVGLNGLNSRYPNPPRYPG
jgi:hypothetical protein